MTKKFWKFVTEDGCSPGKFGKIKYIPGGTIEVEDADPNTKKQCASGIHCLDFSDGMYDDENIIFGPKVAILEVNEEDIIYYRKGGKCRVEKAKVLEIKEPELWMRTGNNNPAWSLDCAYICGHHPDLMQVIIGVQDARYAYCYARDVLERHDETLMEIIINSNDLHYSYLYAREVLKGHDERLMQVIIDSKSAQYAYYYAKSILKRHDERLMKIICNSSNVTYAYDYAYKIIKRHDEGLMQVIINAQDAECAYCYARDVLKGHSEKLMNVIRESSYYQDLYEKYLIEKEKNND